MSVDKETAERWAQEDERRAKEDNQASSPQPTTLTPDHLLRELGIQHMQIKVLEAEIENLRQQILSRNGAE